MNAGILQHVLTKHICLMKVCETQASIFYYAFKLSALYFLNLINCWIFILLHCEPYFQLIQPLDNALKNSGTRHTEDRVAVRWICCAIISNKGLLASLYPRITIQRRPHLTSVHLSGGDWLRLVCVLPCNFYHPWNTMHSEVGC